VCALTKIITIIMMGTWSGEKRMEDMYYKPIRGYVDRDVYRINLKDNESALISTRNPQEVNTRIYLALR